MEIDPESLSHPRRPRPCYRCREREPGRLQLRVVQGLGEEGVCEILVEERANAVEVLVLVCGEGPSDDPCDCPHHVYLDSPLGGRLVLDVARDHALVERMHA